MTIIKLYIDYIHIYILYIDYVHRLYNTHTIVTKNYRHETIIVLLSSTYVKWPYYTAYFCKHIRRWQSPSEGKRPLNRWKQKKLERLLSYLVTESITEIIWILQNFWFFKFNFQSLLFHNIPEQLLLLNVY